MIFKVRKFFDPDWDLFLYLIIVLVSLHAYLNITRRRILNITSHFVNTVISFFSFDQEKKNHILYFDPKNYNQVLDFPSSPENRILTYASLVLGNELRVPQEWLSLPKSLPEQLFFGDIDGNGTTDALFLDSFNNGGQMADALFHDVLESRDVLVGLSTGKEFLPAKPWLRHGKSFPGQLVYMDYDGDGMHDAIYFDLLRSQQIWIGKSLGDRFEAPKMWVRTPHKIPSWFLNCQGRWENGCSL